MAQVSLPRCSMPFAQTAAERYCVATLLVRLFELRRISSSLRETLQCDSFIRILNALSIRYLIDCSVESFGLECFIQSLNTTAEHRSSYLAPELLFHFAFIPVSRLLQPFDSPTPNDIAPSRAFLDAQEKCAVSVVFEVFVPSVQKLNGTVLEKEAAMTRDIYGCLCIETMTSFGLLARSCFLCAPWVSQEAGL